MSGLNEIWKSEKGGLPEDKLIAYFEGKLSAEEQHDVERWLADEGMESDAFEGLTYIHAAETKHTVSRLNHKLAQDLKAKKHKRRKPIKDNPTAIIAVVVILLLVIIAYVVIQMMFKK